MSNNETEPDVIKRIIGYYIQKESSEISTVGLSRLTHAVFGSLRVQLNGTFEIGNAFSKRKFKNWQRAVKNSSSNVKSMISIGRWDSVTQLSSVLLNVKSRRMFIESIVDFLKEHQLDGIDLFWRWVPLAVQSEFCLFLEEVKIEFLNQEKQYILSITAPPVGIENYEDGYDIEEIIERVDFVNVYSMNYAAPWSNQWGTPTGPSAPLYGGLDARRKFSVDYTMKYYIRYTRKPEKFNLIIPFYVRHWRNVENAIKPGIEVFRNVTLQNNGAIGEVYMSRWTAESDGIELSNPSWDDTTKTLYIWKPETKTFITFETEKSIEAKANYVKSMNLGGVWIWLMENDDQDNSMIEAVSGQFGNPSDDQSQYGVIESVGSHSRNLNNRIIQNNQ
ncbi:GH18 domain-containing protein [Caenorhabditis elegans]|uniref:GH18 domain-containing protein n=1 Tax=Caenorhabditis elegans TaxID=6239 RepID=Q18644_CAEEL|nr:GH18 domain-containing protein [Caenorhabditis elegans]CCD67370.2 GH18 domain-containing protein [Caenorhabditis elegans]|eukprot:NP_500856.2 CHItinase-Like [Caenorhabditis elegans]